MVNPSMFTYEYLNNLKFKELQKLSVKFQVNKRWAKKVSTQVLSCVKKKNTNMFYSLNFK